MGKKSELSDLFRCSTSSYLVFKHNNEPGMPLQAEIIRKQATTEVTEKQNV